ncbi:kinase-like domain-containing protein [Thelephora terrestris]|uniref:Kinase-like domain-containing protein n=1 Tax=Thelephora terrestris TaxID=56493 RepID=A0A9P6L5W0_9AGAM|nr:kinase-like domain-containing protein [Thelephora terrestris]
MESLYRVCAGHSLLPRSLHIELGDNLAGAPSRRGGFGEVWKRDYRGQQVAVKVLKVYEDSDLRKVTRRFCKEFITWKFLRHPNVLPLLGVIMSGNQLMMVSEWMPNGNITEFVKTHENVNRLELLVGVAKGLVYMHEQKMAHGDLKGVNILIDGNANARLADFGLLSIMPDNTDRLSSKSLTQPQAGTLRWMSPELLDSKSLNNRRIRPTESSDCYALGMVVYEVLSGDVPFFRYGAFQAVLRVLKGKRPKRPTGAKGAWFNDDIWSVLEHCWKSTPSDRLEATDVLLCLEKGSRSWSPPHAMDSDSSAEDSTDESMSYASFDAASLESSTGFSSVGKPSIVLVVVGAQKNPKANSEARESHQPVVSRRVIEEVCIFGQRKCR